MILRFTFREPNIIDMDMSVETLANFSGFEVLLSAYLGEGFVSGAYVAEKELGDETVPEQIRITDQPMIHGVWPFFPRDEAGANLLTDGRHQKGRWYWRMAIGRRYGRDPVKHANLYERFLKEFESDPRTYQIDPTK